MGMFVRSMEILPQPLPDVELILRIPRTRANIDSNCEVAYLHYTCTIIGHVEMYRDAGQGA